jgi:tetratricopeptide (TPR) repeat protein
MALNRSSATQRFLFSTSALLVSIFAIGCSTSGGVSTTGDIPTSDTNQPQKVVDDGARKLFERAVSLYGNTAKGGDLSKVESLLERAVSKDDCFARAHFNLGVVKQEQGDFDDAIDAYREAHGCDGTFAAPLVNTGIIYMSQGESDKAFEIFERAIGVEEFNPQANINLAVIYRQRAGAADNQEDYLKAVNHVRRALAGDSTSVPAYNTLARVYFDLGKFDLARLVCLNAMDLEKGENDPDILNTLGLIFMKLDDVTTALRQFKKAVEANPDYVDAHLNIGSIALSTRDSATAIKHFELVIALEPSHVEANLSLAVAYRQAGELDKGMAGYEKVLTLDAENAQAVFNIAVMHHEIRAAEAPNPDVAVENYRTAIEFYRKFLSYEKRGDTELRQDADRRIANCVQLIEAQEQLKEILKEEQENLKRQEEAAKAEEAASAGDAPEGNAPADSTPAENAPEGGGQIL